MQTARQELSAKIVYYGPGLSGKTTNLQFIHSHLPKGTTGKLVSMTTRTDRTLFFDYLPVDLGDVDGRHTRFLLYTVPGQVYYNATRKLVLKDADAIVFVADSSAAQLDANVASMHNLEENLQEYGVTLQSIPWVIQYNKRDLEDAMPVIDLHKKLNPLGVPAFEATATAGVGVYETLQGIAMRLHSKLAARAARQKSEGAEDAGLPNTDDVTVAVDDALREVAGEKAPSKESETSSLGFDIEHVPTGDDVRIAAPDDAVKSDDDNEFITDPMRPKNKDADPAPTVSPVAGEREEKVVDLTPSPATEKAATTARPVRPAVAPAPPPRPPTAKPQTPAKTNPSPPSPTPSTASAVAEPAPKTAAPQPPATSPASEPVEVHVPVTLSKQQVRKAVPIKIVLDIRVDDA